MPWSRRHQGIRSYSVELSPSDTRLFVPEGLSSTPQHQHGEFSIIFLSGPELLIAETEIIVIYFDEIFVSIGVVGD